MFKETLLESSPTASRRRRWPMATAFTFQILVVSVLVAVPLLSAGIIPLASPSMPVPISYDKPAAQPHDKQATGRSMGGRPAPTHDVVTITGTSPKLSLGSRPKPDEPVGTTPGLCLAHCDLVSSGPPNLQIAGQPVKPKHIDGPVRMSHIDPGMLITRVVPEYPAMAGRTGVQGEVKMHAIIGRDGSIQSLTVISGHPFLITAAMEAVQQWKYRPYFLNGEAVEVDTYITVNFRKNN